MANYMTGFPDGSVAMISPDRKQLFGIGPNRYQQFGTQYVANYSQFSPIPLPLAPEELIAQVVAGGSGDTSSLFVLLTVPKRPQDLACTPPTRLPLWSTVRILVFCQRIDPYALPITTLANGLHQMNLPTIRATESNDTPIPLPIEDVAVYQNNVILTTDSGNIYANLSALVSYGLAAHDKLASSKNFCIVDFPRTGDTKPRVPKRCLLAEYYMFVITTESKAYFCGVNRKTEGQHFVDAIFANRFLEKTSKGFAATMSSMVRRDSRLAGGKENWQTFGYAIRGTSYKTIWNMVIAPDSTSYVSTPHGALLSLELGGRLYYRTRPILPRAIAATTDNLYVIHSEKPSEVLLIGFGHQARAQLGQSYKRVKALTEKQKGLAMPMVKAINITALVPDAKQVIEMCMTPFVTLIITADNGVIGWGDFLSNAPKKIAMPWQSAMPSQMMNRFSALEPFSAMQQPGEASPTAEAAAADSSDFDELSYSTDEFSYSTDEDD
jgi:hypothetical protein